MNRLAIPALAAASTVFLAVAAPGAAAQSAPDIAGTWTLVSATVQQQGGATSDVFGPDPMGTIAFGADGRYALIFLRRGLPKFASNNRASGTPEENKAVVQGSIAHFGTYAVEDGGKTLVFRVQAGTFPNWDGAEQRRVLALRGDELTYTVASSVGGTAQVTLRRAK